MSAVELPPGFSSVEELVGAVRDWSESGKKTVDAVSPRWDLQRRLYENGPADDVGEVMGASMAWPLAQPLCDALCGFVIKALTFTGQVCVASPRRRTLRGDAKAAVGRAAEASADMADVMEEGDLLGALRQTGKQSCWSDTGIVRVRIENGGAVSFYTVDPSQLRVWPNTRPHTWEQKFIGYTDTHAASDVEALVSDGVYVCEDGVRKKLGPRASTDTRSEAMPSATETNTPGPTEHTAGRTDFTVELLHGYARFRKKGEAHDSWWHIVADSPVTTILRCAELPGRAQGPALFRFGFKGDPDGRLVHGASVLADVQQLATAVNRLATLFSDSAEMAGSGAGFADPNSGVAGLDSVPFRGGHISLFQGATEVKTLATSPDLAPVIGLMDRAVDMGARVLRMSAMGTGNPINVESGSEAQGVLAGQDAGVSDYVRQFGSELPRLYAYVHARLASDEAAPKEAARPVGEPGAKPVTSTTSPVENQEYVWRLASASPEDSPRHQEAVLRDLVMMAMAADPAAMADVGVNVPELVRAYYRLVLARYPALADSVVPPVPPQGAQPAPPPQRSLPFGEGAPPGPPPGPTDDAGLAEALSGLGVRFP